MRSKTSPIRSSVEYGNSSSPPPPSWPFRIGPCTRLPPPAWTPTPTDPMSPAPASTGAAGAATVADGPVAYQPRIMSCGRSFSRSNKGNGAMARTARLSALASVLAIALLPSTAHATIVHHCGNYGVVTGQAADKDGVLRPHFTMQRIDGSGVYDIVSAVTSCRMARRVVRAEENSGRRRVLGYTCTTRRRGVESARTRCTAEGERRVVQYDSGA